MSSATSTLLTDSSMTAATTPKPFTNSKAPPTGRPTTEILRKLLVYSDGRDKSLKIIQYFGKIVLWLHVNNNKSKYPKLYPRLIAMTSQFSNTRKIIRLAHFLEPYTDIKEYITGTRNSSSATLPYEKVIHYSGFINSIIGILNDIFDDLYCLGKIGVLNKSVAKRAEPIAIRLWFMTIILDIHEVIFRIWLLNEKVEKPKGKLSENDLKILKDKKYWLYVSLVKLTMDFGFCGYDVFECKFSDGIQAITGFIAGILGIHKLWVKEKLIS